MFKSTFNNSVNFMEGNPIIAIFTKDFLYQSFLKVSIGVEKISTETISAYVSMCP